MTLQNNFSGFRFAAGFVILCGTLLMSCSSDVTTPTEIKSQDLSWQIGERAVFRRTSFDDGVAMEYSDDTMVVVGRNTVNGNVEITWDSAVVWRVVDNGEFEVEFLDYKRTLGMIPAPSGRWPNYKDTFFLTSSEGAVIGKYLGVMTTITSDTTIQTPAGSFRCAVFEQSYETVAGKRVADFGMTILFYAPGIGVIRGSEYVQYAPNDKLYHVENRLELIKVIR